MTGDHVWPAVWWHVRQAIALNQKGDPAGLEHYATALRLMGSL